MQCQEAREHIIGHLTGSLDETTRADVRDHLARCASCRSEAKAHDWTWGMLAGIPGASFDPDAMRAQFDAMMAEQETAFRKTGSAAFWRPLVAAAAVIAVVAGAGWRAGWLTSRSTAVLLPEPAAHERPQADLPEPFNP